MIPLYFDSFLRMCQLFYHLRGPIRQVVARHCLCLSNRRDGIPKPFVDKLFVVQRIQIGDRGTGVRCDRLQILHDRTQHGCHRCEIGSTLDGRRFPSRDGIVVLNQTSCRIVGDAFRIVTCRVIR